jgi:chromosome partitioning protein
MIISVLNQKGGVGKTTLSVNLAAAFVESGCSVLLVDADPQGSSLAWSAARQRDALFPVVGMAKKSLHKDLPRVADDYDVTLIDGCPRVNEIARSAILASDMILIPVQPSPVDVWATDEIVQLVEEAQQFRDTIDAAFVVNRKIVNTAIGRDVRVAFKGLPFPLLKEAVCQRVVFAESFAEGMSVLEVQPNKAAAKEVRELAEKLIKPVKTKKRRAA